MRNFLTACFLSSAFLSANPREEYEQEIKPLLEAYCFDCHGDGTKKGDFSMDSYPALTSHLKDHSHWLAIWRNVRSQIMPPSDKDQLIPDEKRQLLAWIQKEVFQLDPDNPDPGAVTIRRLNRTEYQNAVYDLLGVEFDTTEEFPPDDSGYGFDNIGDVLSISPVLMEKYIAAADEIVTLALPEGAAAQVPIVEIDGKEFAAPGDPTLTGRWIPFKRAASLAFDVRLREDMQRETHLLFDFILRKGRPVEELISARYTFLNERLADFYGITGIIESAPFQKRRGAE